MPPCFYVFKAGAGSGKTYNLVLQYLYLALASPTDMNLFRHILAITFTNKAAGEMKERILSTLVALANGTDRKGYDNELKKMLHIEEQELQHRARNVRNAVLHNYSDLSVCTIDSFMMGVARTFSHDLNIGNNVSVELDEKYVSQHIVDQLMLKVGPQQDITELLCKYGEARMDDGKNANLLANLQKSAADLFKEDAILRLKMLDQYNFTTFANSHDALTKETRQYETTCVAKARIALAACDEQGLTSTDFAGGDRSSIYLWLKKIKDGKATFGTLGANAQRMYDDPSHVLLPSTQGKKGDTPDKLLAVQNVVWQAVQYIKEGAQLYNTRKALLVHLYDVALLSEMRKLLEEYFKDNEVISLTEVSNRISQEVKDQPAPFLFERLGNHYHHFLIDEFQDTSREQWHNLLPLILNGISSGSRSLVVGDAKQAIYRFRNGDVRQFVDLPKVEPYGSAQVLPEYSMLEYAYGHEELNKNFRTLGNVVQFNNHLFTYLIKNQYDENELLKRIYLGPNMDFENPELWQQDNHNGGYVKLSFWQQCEALNNAVLEEVLLQHDKGYAYGDITILADSNKILSTLSNYLTTHQDHNHKFLRVASSESLLLSSSLVIRLLRCLLYFLLRPTERLWQLQILDYLRQLQLLPANDLVEPFNRQEPTPSASHTEGEQGSHYALNLIEYLQQNGFPQFNPRRLTEMSLYDCIEELVRCFRLDHLDNAFLATMLNFVSDYIQLHPQDHATFLEYFDKKWDTLSCNAATDDGAVRLMTVHKSKGLESPIIIYLLPLSQEHKSLQWVDVDKQVCNIALGQVTLKKNISTMFDDVLSEEQKNKEMDDVNRLYVALTRAKEKLIVIAQQKPKSKDAVPTLSNHLHDFAERGYGTEPSTNGQTLCTKEEVTIEKQGDATSPHDIHEETVVFHGALYYYGEDGEKQKNDSQKDIFIVPISHSLSNISFPRWNDRIIVADQNADILSARTPSTATHGLLMHELLSQIHRSDDVTHVVNHYALIHELNDRERKALAFHIDSIVNGIETSRFFASGVEVLNECTLIYKGEELRPDRVIFDNDTAYVVDFKTGKTSSQHALQVQHYCCAIQAIRHMPVEGYLLYIADDPQLQRVV